MFPRCPTAYRTIPACCLLLAACCLLSGAEPRPFDWPQWHGPERTAFCKETGLLKAWPKDGPPLVWKATKLGGGYSAPAVAAGRVYGMSHRGGDEIVWALDEATGKEVWSQRIAPAGKVSRGEGPRGTPTVDGDRLYALGVVGDLACLESATGKIVWQKNFKTDFNGRMMSGWGYSESPLVDGDKIVCVPGGADATVLALNKNTGEVVWKAQVPGGDGAGYASLVVSEGGGVRQYVALLGRGIVGIAASDGKFLWRYDRVANRTANIPTPIVRGNHIFCSTGYNTGSALLELKPASGGVKADEVYFLAGKELQNHHGGLVLVGEHIYGGHGHNNGAPVCIEMMTGKFAWRQDRGAGSGSAAVLYADGNLYFRFQSGLMALIEATPKAYTEISSFKLPDNSGMPSWPHPVIANGKLYIRDQNNLLCFDVKQAK